ncbi:MAG: hypothetical protein ACE5OZ_12945 [Candidatus Heimdallarchaeota archaeon]
MTSEFELSAKRPSANRWIIHGVIAIAITVISVWLMVDIASDNILNFFILMMVTAAGILYTLAIFGFFRERARKKRLARIRSRRYAAT